MGYRLQSILDLATGCFRLGVRHAVLSPGSRVAPLTLAFSRHSGIATRTIPDERAAGYIALGLAQASNTTVVLACTSGTAMLNYAPAIAEAFYQQIPLLVLTADRPPEWVDQQDGQTIRQQGVHVLHCKASYQLPTDYAHADAQWAIRRILAEALHTAQAFPQGPVHINVPIREPFYPEGDDILEAIPSENAVFVRETAAERLLPAHEWEFLLEAWRTAERPMIVPGQGRGDAQLMKSMEALHCPILSEPIANCHGLEQAIYLHDTVLMGLEEDVATSLAPDFLITFGNSIVSKGLKQFLRKYPPKRHLHVQEAGSVADPFQTLTDIVRTSPPLFFERLSQEKMPSTAFLHAWQVQQEKAKRAQEVFFQQQTHFGEFEAVKLFLKQIPRNQSVQLHLANSMAVRLASFAGDLPPHVTVFSNRGTSGIDGCSTAVGHVLANPTALHLLITGDMAFLYDRNAFWHNYALPNLRILLVNNHGGGIFRMIPGPNRLPETDDYFVTKQPLSAAGMAAEFGMERRVAQTKEAYLQALPWLLGENNDAPKLLEFFTESPKDAAIWEAYKRIKK